MKKLFLMLLVMLSTFCFISMANVNAEGEPYHVTSGSELIYSAEGGIAYQDLIAHADMLDVKYGESGLAITESNKVINLKGHVVNLYRLKVFVTYIDGSQVEVSRLFDSKDGGGLTEADSNGYFEYHGDLGQDWVGKTITQIGFQCYTLDKTSERIGELQLLGIVFDADGSYNSFADLYVAEGGSGSVEPEQPETPTSTYVFEAADSATTVENNVATMSGESGAIVVPVEVSDVTAVHIALQYKANGVTGIETVAYGNGEEVAWPAVIMPKGWNVTETSHNDTVIATVDITASVAAFTGLTAIRFNLTGTADATLEVVNFAVTADGNHGFIKEEEPEEPEIPDDGTLKISEFTSSDFTISNNADGEQVITYGAREASYPSMTAEVKNYDPNFTVLKLEYTASDVVKFGFNINGVIDWSLGHASYAAGTHTITLSTANYVAEGETSLPSTFSIQVYVDAETVVTADKEITIHSVTFTTPDPEPEGMWLGTPKATGLNCFEGENGYDISYNNDTASWRNVEISVNNYEVEYDVIRIKLNVTEKTNVGVYVTYLDELGAATDTHIRNHWTAEGVVAATGDLDLVFLLGAHIDTGKTITSIKVYFDNPTDFTTNTGDCTAKLLSYELLKSADLDLTDLEFSLEDATFDYTGESVELDVECAEDVNFRFEYSNANAPEGEEVVWNTGTPKNAGEYNIRVSFLGSLEYNYATITAKVTINKVKATVNADDVTVDTATRVVTVKDGIEASTDSEFAEGSEVLDGDEVPYGTVIYYRNAGDKNHTASDVLELKVERPVEDNPGEDNPGEDTPTEPGDDQPTEPGTGETPTPTPTPEKGCLGSVGASIIGVFALLGACLVAKRRKED